MTLCIFGREIEIKKTVLAVIIISAVVIIGGIGFAIAGSGRDIIIEGNSAQNTSGGADNDKATDKKSVGRGVSGDVKEKSVDGNSDSTSVNSADTNEEQAEKQESIKVYVVGCVKKPGVITLNKGQLIDDAVKAAGGLTAEADPGSINMVYELKENVMLNIQSKKEMNTAKPAGDAGRGIKLVKDSGSAIVTGAGEGGKVESTGAKEGKININTASATELDKLPGVGEATARDIISYRETNGPFQKTSDIMKIPRIKESRYNAIKDLITVD